MSTHTPRTFEVPAALVAAGYPQTADLDVLDREVEIPGEFGEWAEKVLFQENTKVLSDVCGDMRLLPRGILSAVQLQDESLLIGGLIDSDGRVWDGGSNTWVEPTEGIDVETETIILSDDEIAFVARALREGADEVWFRPYLPKAFVSAVVAAPAPPQDQLGKKGDQPELPPEAQEVPAGSAIVAVVDPIDEDAVLEMLAIAPGPSVLRRHDGNWFEDPEWVTVLTSIKPPKIVKLNEAQVASVSSQVDRSTNEQDWEFFESKDREQYQIFTASSYLSDLLIETQQRALDALLAAAGREITPKDISNTERLKRYWTIGKGAAKIRWGTPGSWRRCYRHLLEHVGPKIAPGYCTNLSKRLGGPGVATHVTSAVGQPVVAANPSGVNGYSKGMSFEESTDGVVRDKNGKFAPESGGKASHAGRFKGTTTSNAGDRAERRRRSMERSKAAREEKAAKKTDSEDNKAKQERIQNQKQQLANLSLQIAQAVAAKDVIKAAELRVQRAEKVYEFADTEVKRTNAMATLINARTSLARTKAANSRSKGRRGGTSMTLPYEGK